MTKQAQKQDKKCKDVEIDMPQNIQTRCQLSWQQVCNKGRDDGIKHEVINIHSPKTEQINPGTLFLSSSSYTIRKNQVYLLLDLKLSADAGRYLQHYIHYIHYIAWTIFLVTWGVIITPFCCTCIIILSYQD